MSTNFHSEFLDKMVNRKLEDRVSGIIRDLDAMPFDIVANREVDKFYYMQKLAELKILDDKLYEALERVRLMMEGRYNTRCELMLRWKKDMKWLTLRRRELSN